MTLTDEAAARGLDLRASYVISFDTGSPYPAVLEIASGTQQAVESYTVSPPDWNFPMARVRTIRLQDGTVLRAVPVHRYEIQGCATTQKFFKQIVIFREGTP